MQRLRAWIAGKARSHGEAIIYRAAGLPLALGGGLPAGSPDSVRIIRGAYRREYWRLKRLSDVADILVAFLILFPGIFLFALKGSAKNGPEIALRSGKGTLHQCAEQIGFALRYGILPPWYYIFELHAPERAARAAHYLGRAETKEGCYPILARHRGANTPLGNKLAFARHCAMHGLPTLQPIGVSRHGKLTLIESEHLESDLFIKPVRASGGSGAWRLDWQRDGFWRMDCGARLTMSEALRRFADCSRTRPMMLQRRLVNHSSLAGICNAALSTVRVLTCLDERDRPEIQGAVLRMASGSNHTVDNLHAGGLAARIDLQSGILSHGTNLGDDVHLGWVDRHPTSGAPISGRRLPFWNEVKELSVRAHLEFDDHAVIGWDIAVLEGGPIIVEGNSGPDLDIMQRVAEEPLGNSRLAELLSFHLQMAGYPAA